MSRNQPTIRTVARQVGVNVETIRYYQRIGLVKEPPKSGGFRFYTEKTVERLLFIRRLKTLGFSLREVTGLLEVSQNDCHAVSQILENKHAEILQKIDQLHLAADELQQMNRDCLDQSSCSGSLPCPNIPGPE